MYKQLECTIQSVAVVSIIDTLYHFSLQNPLWYRFEIDKTKLRKKSTIIPFWMIDLRVLYTDQTNEKVDTSPPVYFDKMEPLNQLKAKSKYFNLVIYSTYGMSTLSLVNSIMETTQYKEHVDPHKYPICIPLFQGSVFDFDWYFDLTVHTRSVSESWKKIYSFPSGKGAFAKLSLALLGFCLLQRCCCMFDWKHRYIVI